MKGSSTANAAMAAFALANVTAFTANAAHAQQANAAPQQTNAAPQQAATPARQNPAPTQVPQITIAAPAEQGGYAADAQYHTDNADLGPLGSQPILNTPTSITAVPEDLMVNQQDRTVNDTLRDLAVGRNPRSTGL